MVTGFNPIAFGAYFRPPMLFRVLVIQAVFFVCSAFALEHPEETLKQEVGINPALGSKVDLTLPFQDSNGNTVQIRDLMVGKPAIIVPVYYGCPRLCGLLLDGASKLFSTISGLELGTDYNVFSVSFDPTNTPDMAAERADHYYNLIKDPAAGPKGWHFLVGQQSSISKLMSQIGFTYKKDGQEYAHTAAIIILTPNGEISQYFTGINFPKWDVKLALVEAASGTIGSMLDHALLFCFRFDAIQGRYTLAVLNLLRVAGVLTMIGLFGLIYGLRRRERCRAGQSNGDQHKGQFGTIGA